MNPVISVFLLRRLLLLLNAPLWRYPPHTLAWTPDQIDCIDGCITALDRCITLLSPGSKAGDSASESGSEPESKDSLLAVEGISIDLLKDSEQGWMNDSLAGAAVSLACVSPADSNEDINMDQSARNLPNPTGDITSNRGGRWAMWHPHTRGHCPTALAGRLALHPVL